MTARQVLEETLGSNTGTVTDFLQALAEEPVDADKLIQEPVMCDPSHPFGGARCRSLVRRVVLLRGRRTHRPFVYAESLLAADRLPEGVRADLDDTDAPIGRVLVAHRLGIEREPLGRPRRAPADVRADLQSMIDQSLWSRSYRILLDQEPVIEIDEWFLPAVNEALGDR